uniref:Adenosylcobinamide-GDP ribazoletransferase n=1 Tax=Archaeoglobus fulgidus TaxID=2234 RepID=A0A7J2TI83_ARCFL
MANTALEILKSSISFLTTIPLKGDIEVLRRNLWIFTFAGTLIGFLISIPSILGLWILCLFLYVAIEGINHIDGLADFGDAFFAPREKKMTAMKDVKIGAGGLTFICLYFLVLYYSFQRVEFLEIVFSQTIAKFSMLLLLTTSKPAWNGLGAYMMEFARKRDLFFGSLPLLISALKPSLIIPALFSILITIAIRRYSEKNFGGVSGDVIGASNCISFASALLICSFETDISILFEFFR